MNKINEHTNLSILVTPEAAWKAGLLIIPAPAADEPAPGLPGPRAGDLHLVESTVEAGSMDEQRLFLSLGPEDRLSADSLRQAGGALARWLQKYRVPEAGLAAAHLDQLDIAGGIEAFCEGLILGSFDFSTWKSASKSPPQATVHILVAGEGAALREKLTRVTAIARAVNLARAWAHEPPNALNPQTLAERAAQLAEIAGLSCQVLTDQDLKAMGAGAIVGVGQGSQTGSRLIILEHKGEGRPADAEPVVVVGKAITFDTGGYTIKTKAGMSTMKFDKSGGMAVIGILRAAAALRLPHRLIGLIPAAENMISADAYRPNDIIRTLSGKTVEIISADAEGRMILADALTYAQQTYRPKALIDIATLTGGVVTALGRVRAGLMANDEQLAGALFAAGERTYERLWQLPLDDDYFDLIKGDDSDFKNSSMVIEATPIVGGIFLKQFVEDGTPWAHIDIAGAGKGTKNQSYTSGGYTGFGIRLILDYLLSMPK